MTGIIRNAIAIGLIAYFSPVHEQSTQERLASLQAAPQQVMQEAIAQGPRLALQAVQAMEPESRARLLRDRLAREDLARLAANVMAEAAMASPENAALKPGATSTR